VAGGRLSHRRPDGALLPEMAWQQEDQYTALRHAAQKIRESPLEEPYMGSIRALWSLNVVGNDRLRAVSVHYFARVEAHAISGRICIRLNLPTISERKSGAVEGAASSEHQAVIAACLSPV
jgi:hypothetical protein